MFAKFEGIPFGNVGVKNQIKSGEIATTFRHSREYYVVQISLVFLILQVDKSHFLLALKQIRGVHSSYVAEHNIA